MKKLNLIRNIFLSNFRRLDSIYKITFALTYRCNMRCKICRIWEVPAREELSIKQIEKIFKSANNLCWLDLTGGEISLREDVMDIIKVIIKNTNNLLILHISTNGQSPRKIFLLAKEVLKSNLIPVINIGIDGPRRIHDELRGAEDGYLKGLESFKLLKSLGKGYYYLSCTLSDYNIDYIDELLLNLKTDIPGFSLQDLHFNIFYNSLHYYRNQTIEGLANTDFENLKKYLLMGNKGNFIKRFLNDRYIRILVKSFKENRLPLKCQALKSSCFINPYGEVYPCTVHDKIAGNLKDYDYNLDAIWNAPNTLKNRKYLENNGCRKCLGTCEVYPAILGDIRRALLV